MMKMKVYSIFINLSTFTQIKQKNIKDIVSKCCVYVVESINSQSPNFQYVPHENSTLYTEYHSQYILFYPHSLFASLDQPTRSL